MPPSCLSTPLPLHPLSHSPIPHTRPLLSLVDGESPDLRTVFFFSCLASISLLSCHRSGSRVPTSFIILIHCCIETFQTGASHWAFPSPIYPANHARAKQGLGVGSVASAGKTARSHRSDGLIPLLPSLEPCDVNVSMGVAYRRC